VGALDLPSEPQESGRGLEESRPRARDRPDPDERGRVYEAMRALVSAETRHEPGGRYWEEMPRLLDQAEAHRERRPDERQAAPDRPADPAGSFRSRGGFYLSPERHAETVAAIGRVREAEPPISADMRAVERENGHGGLPRAHRVRSRLSCRTSSCPSSKARAESRCGHCAFTACRGLISNFVTCSAQGSGSG